MQIESSEMVEATGDHASVSYRLQTVNVDEVKGNSQEIWLSGRA